MSTAPDVTPPRLTEPERRALRRLIDAARRRNPLPRITEDTGRGIVERCLNIESDPYLALDLAVTAHEAIQAGRA